jgi:prepilin-type N-terminal cleavage/methylation domain-containing protein
MRRGFTLIELLVVLFIIGIVSAVTLPMIVNDLSHRQVSEAARIVQAALAGARDAAIRDNAPSGIRLIADEVPMIGYIDPVTGLNKPYPAPVSWYAYSRIVPISVPPAYSDGLVTVAPGTKYATSVLLKTKALVLEEQVLDSAGLPNPPTSWFWNIRVGDKIQIGNAGPWLTVCGPMVVTNEDCFVNYGVPGTASPLGHDYLLLTNGHDDNANGWVDEGWDGVDNDAVNGVDDPAEWEQETWLGSLVNGVTGAQYTIRRRPAPTIGARETVLPTDVVIDYTRSNVQVNPLMMKVVNYTNPTNGQIIPVVESVVDIVVNPDGSMAPALLYSTPASVFLGSSFTQLWLSERADLGSFTGQPPVWTPRTPTGQWWLVSANGKTGRVSDYEQPDLITGLNDARQQ